MTKRNSKSSYITHNLEIFLHNVAILFFVFHKSVVGSGKIGWDVFWPELCFWQISLKNRQNNLISNRLYTTQTKHYNNIKNFDQQGRISQPLKTVLSPLITESKQNWKSVFVGSQQVVQRMSWTGSWLLLSAITKWLKGKWKLETFFFKRKVTKEGWRPFSNFGCGTTEEGIFF